mgnify:CR=1 FL=1
MKKICCRNLALLLAALLIFLQGGCASGKEQKGAVSDSSGVTASSETDRDLSKTEKEEKTPEKSVGEETIVPTAAAAEEPTPSMTPEAAGRMVAIDAGHQSQGNAEQEPIGPGASETKAKVSSGTYGPASGLNEYELNLQVALKLRDELQARGYQVCMIRETNEVDISNRERAETAAAAGADILVRIHANGSEDPSVSGALTMAPSGENPYVGSLAPACQELSRDILDAFCAATGASSQGVYITDTMGGINWSTIPVTIVEMGYMTNAREDLNMASGEYQQLMAQGIANGIDAYFAG